MRTISVGPDCQYCYAPIEATGPDLIYVNGLPAHRACAVGAGDVDETERGHRAQSSNDPPDFPLEPEQEVDFESDTQGGSNENHQ